jgi:hypothetical protein
MALVFWTDWSACGAELSKNAPNQHTPEKLIEAWLRFHETELCQEADVVFIFDARGMMAWYVSKDDGINQKLQELFQPLNGSYRVEFYPTHKQEEKKSIDDEGPPPSLYMNGELREHMMGIPERLDIPSSSDPDNAKGTDSYRKWALNARLVTYAEQIFDWNRKVKRYAMDLPMLARLAFDDAGAPAMRSLALAVCKAHALSMGKDLSKLETNLKQAFPKGDKIERTSKPEKPGKTKSTPVESADQISEDAQNIVHRINKFIYPENHAVGLDELRQPSLLEALSTVEKKVQDFQRALPIPPIGKMLANGKSR